MDRERLSHIHRTETVPLPPALASEEAIMKKIQTLRHESIIRHPTAPSKTDITDRLESFSRSLRTEGKLLQSLADKRVAADFWRPRRLPMGTDPSSVHPSKADLTAKKAFGKPHICHSYTVTPGFPQIVLLLFKSKFLEPRSQASFFAALPRSLLIFKKWQTYRDIDFRAIRYYNFDWENSSTLNTDRQFLREACLFHYDLCLATLQRYSGGRFTGDHRRVEHMLQAVYYVLSEDTFTKLIPGYIDGIPNYLHANVPYEQFQKYKDRANQRNMDRHPSAAITQLIKEDARDIGFILDANLADFIPHLGLIPLGISTPNHKKPRLYRHGTFQLSSDSQPINTIVDIKATEPEIRYATVLIDHCQYLWSLRASFPQKRISSYDDDVSGAFNHRTFHPDTARANASLYKDWLIIALGMHFGGNFCPPNWEPVSWARCEIAKFLFDNCTYQVSINTEILKLISIETPKQHNFKITEATLPKEKLIQLPNGKPDAQFRMFVDDLLSAIIHKAKDINRLATSSIEAIYVLLGYPGPIEKPTIPAAAAWDKMVDRPIGEYRLALGYGFNSYRLIVDIPRYKVERFLLCLDKIWHKGRRQFEVLEAAQLQGNILSFVFACEWLRYSLFSIMDQLQEGLRRNRGRIVRSKHFQELLAEPDDAWLDVSKGKFTKLQCLNTSIARDIWRCKQKTAITTVMRTELEWLRLQARRMLKGQQPWERPLSHIVTRPPDGIACHDACIKYGMGGWSIDWGYWWQISWNELHHDIADTLLNRYEKTGKILTSINVLEFAAAWVNYVACCYMVKSGRKKYAWQPQVLFYGDNTASESWCHSCNLSQPKARAIAKLYCHTMMHSNVGGTHIHISTDDNALADAFSRTPVRTVVNDLNVFSPCELRELLQAPSECQSIYLQRFHLSAELRSELALAILQPNMVNLPTEKSKKLGRISPDESILFNLSPSVSNSGTHHSVHYTPPLQVA
jgi:hypothetical protein